MRPILKYIFLICIMSSILFSCASRKKIVYLQDIEKSKSYNSSLNYEPKLQPDDLLSIIVAAENPEVTVIFNLPNIQVAAYLVGIAKKESSWGSASPSKDGKTCYNYWGYKGAGSREMALGYGCFGSPEEAVKIVGARISKLLNQNLDSPARMVVWKCGSSCAGQDSAGVQKWISDVSIYYDKVMGFGKS